jgi:hypothetical protein
MADRVLVLGGGPAFPPEVHHFVGGGTTFYGAAACWLREQDFGELKHHGGISPAWPGEPGCSSRCCSSREGSSDDRLASPSGVSPAEGRLTSSPSAGPPAMDPVAVIRSKPYLAALGERSLGSFRLGSRPVVAVSPRFVDSIPDANPRHRLLEASHSSSEARAYRVLAFRCDGPWAHPGQVMRVA